MSTSDRILKIHFWELCRVISNDNTSYFARYAWTLFSKLNWWLLSLLKEHPIVRHQVRGREKKRKRGSLPKQPSYFAPHCQDISQGEETSLAAGTTREGCFHRLEERERGGFLRSNPSLFFLLTSRWTVPSTWKPQGCRLSTRPLWPLDCSSVTVNIWSIWKPAIHALFTGSHYDSWRRIMRLSLYWDLSQPRNGWPHPQGLQPLLFSNSMGSFTPHKNQISESAVRSDLTVFIIIRAD